MRSFLPDFRLSNWQYKPAGSRRFWRGTDRTVVLFALINGLWQPYWIIRFLYEAGKKGEPQRISLHGRTVSFFEWLPDRDLAIFATSGKDEKTGKFGVYIAQYNPIFPDRELDTPIEDAPRDSKIVDVAYSTATNVSRLYEIRSG